MCACAGRGKENNGNNREGQLTGEAAPDFNLIRWRENGPQRCEMRRGRPSWCKASRQLCPTRLRNTSEDADVGEGTKCTSVGGKAGGDDGSDQLGVSPGEMGPLPHSLQRNNILGCVRQPCERLEMSPETVASSGRDNGGGSGGSGKASEQGWG